MGGHSFCCILCGKWFVSGGEKQHLKDKHKVWKLTPENLRRYNAVYNA